MASSALAHVGAVTVAMVLLGSLAHADVRTPLGLALSSAPIDQLHSSEISVYVPRSPDAVLAERVTAGHHWRLETVRGVVHVWAPADYDAETAAVVVFVHGYWINVDVAWESYRLAQQFALSGINALFIAPDAPATKREPIAWPSLAQLVRAVADHVDIAMPAKRLVAVGHSGAYRTLARWLTNPALDTVVQLDALYTEYGLLRWVRGSKEHRMVNIVYETGRFSDYLHRWLPSTQRVNGLPRAGLPEARILYVRTEVGHWELVTGGVALPLALRAIGVPLVASAPLDLPMGLSPREAPPPAMHWIARPPCEPRFIELAP